MRKFKLSREQVQFLQKEYADNPLVKKVLSSEDDGMFEVTADIKIEFMEYIEDESVYWMGKDYEATQKTWMLESIRDSIYYQTN